ncbi:MAG: T9SS type A sorting domain-containing protein [Paludibacter sp.]|nr:T9SS type A sorting domain-containing protein [Paludibacter sp.]
MRLNSSILIQVLFFITSFSVSSQNLLVNFDFENDLNGWERQVLDNVNYGATFDVSTVEKHLGNKSAHVHVSKVKNDYWAFRYFQIRLKQTGFTLHNGDVVRLRFWAKVNSTDLHPMVQAGLAKNAPEKIDFWSLEDYDMSNFLVSNIWKQYEMNLFITKEVGNDVMFLLRVGGMSGDYYFDDIDLEVIKNSASDFNWLDNAQSRIDILRKGDLKLKILDKNGLELPQATASVKLLRHNFQWGTSVRVCATNQWNTSSFQWERSEVLKMFNTIVHENDFKWPVVEKARNSPDYSAANQYVNWKDQNNLQFRGHCLYWTKDQWMPSWWISLSSDSAKVNALKQRCKRDPLYFKGRVFDYDVVNEPVHFTYVEDLIGDSIYTKTFQSANQSDPQANLQVNEWWNIDKWDSWRLRKWVETRLSENAPIHSIGLQAHWDNERIDWLEVKQKSDYLAEIGLPLKITEFDMDYNRIFGTDNAANRVKQAEDYGKIMRLVFSHPAYNGFLIWGLKDGWRPNAGIFNSDMTARPSRDTIYKLVKQTWTTEYNGQASSNGGLNYNGYFGDYQIDINYGGVSKTYFVNFSKNQIEKILTTDFVKGVNAINLINSDGKLLKIYPNPTSDFISLEIPGSSNHMATVTLYNLSGGVVYQYKYPQASIVRIDFKDFEKGAYILSVEIDNNIKQVKLIKK